MKSAKKTNKKNEGSSVETGTELGMIKIHEGVIVSITSKAIANVEGVTKLAGSSLVDNIADIVGSKKLHDRAITVKLDGANVEIEVKINIKFDSHIPTIANNVQTVVIEAVEKATGMNVKTVDVVIQEVDFVEEKPAEED